MSSALRQISALAPGKSRGSRITADGPSAVRKTSGDKKDTKQAISASVKTKVARRRKARAPRGVSEASRITDHGSRGVFTGFSPVFKSIVIWCKEPIITRLNNIIQEVLRSPSGYFHYGTLRQIIVKGCVTYEKTKSKKTF